MNSPACCRCKYGEETLTNLGAIRICRYNSPQVIDLRQRSPRHGVDSGPHTFWPTVGDLDWCGRFVDSLAAAVPQSESSPGLLNE